MIKNNTVFALLVIINFCTYNTYGQSCPACSNPAIQSSEKVEAGMDTLLQGTFRSTLISVAGFDYQGGHPNWKGLTSEKEIIDVPLHNHVVELDFYRFQLNLEYTFKNNWTTWLQIPYDIKVQRADIEFVETVSDYERDRDNHHRNENYTGLSDFKLLVAHRKVNVFSKKDRFDIAIGTSLPIGAIEENPLEAGANGEKHLHIQFGTGAFNPLLELHYSTRLSKKLTVGAFTISKYPFYANKNKYIGAVESTSGISVGYRILNWLVIRTNFANLYMSQAKWGDQYDPNSGLVAYNGVIGTTIIFNNGLVFTPGFRFPIYQKTLTGDGDTFEFGPTVLLNISFPFNTK